MVVLVLPPTFQPGFGPGWGELLKENWRQTEPLGLPAPSWPWAPLTRLWLQEIKGQCYLYVEEQYRLPQFARASSKVNDLTVIQPFVGDDSNFEDFVNVVVDGVVAVGVVV